MYLWQDAEAPMFLTQVFFAELEVISIILGHFVCLLSTRKNTGQDKSRASMISTTTTPGDNI